jgi:hypothetical protein
VSSTAPGQATFYRPAEVATMLRCSEWWIKEQARKRRIPYSWIGGSYLFTDEHITEIVRLFEVRPVEVGELVDQPGAPARRSRTSSDGDAPIRLQPRIPRRARIASASQSSAA